MRVPRRRWRVGSRLTGLLAALLFASAALPQSGRSDGPAERAKELARSGDFEAAIPLLRAAVEQAEANGDVHGRVSGLVQLAEAQQAIGRHRDSLATLAEAQAAAGAAASAAELAAIHGALANASLALGAPARAGEELARALELARQAKAAPLIAALLNERGNFESARGAWPEAARDYAESAALAEGAGEHALAARAFANQGRAAVHAGSSSAEARQPLTRAITLAAELPASHDTEYVMISSARSFARLADGPRAAATSPDLAEAHRLLVAAEAMATGIGDLRGRSYALGYLGELYEDQRRFAEALALTRRALFAAQQASAPESVYRWHWQAGRLLRAIGEPAQAIASYRQVVAVLAGVRYELAQASARGEGAFRDAVGPVFFELIDLLLATAPPPSEAAAHQARLTEARETLELLKAAELRDYFRDECVDQLEAKVQRLDQIARNVVVIYPVVLPDRLELLLTLPSGLRRVTVPVSGDVLGAEVRQLRFLLEKRTTREFLPRAQRVYDWLVRPFEAELAGLGIETLVFVPDGALRTIPMAALHDGERFLIERYAVATTPGLSLTDPRPLDRGNLVVFSSGLSEAVQGFPALENVPSELASLHALFGGTELIDGEFRLPRVEGELEQNDYGIVHVATHGEFSEDPASSFLLTYDGRLTLDRLGATVGRTRLRERPIELITLSACETAEGSERAALGLAGVAVQAGARSALGSLWSVNDAAATELLTAFYRELKEQPVSKAVALQRAQRALIADPNRRHPFYWSAFLLINNWL
jgi:CHAT domain-containing protein